MAKKAPHRLYLTEDQIHHVVGKVLLQFGIIYDRMKSWEGRR